MRKIIHNKVYDTETASLVGHWSNGRSGGDYISVTLYRKKTGEYFAAKQVGEYVSDLFYSEQVATMGYEQAREWAESHLEADEYEREFGTPSEGDAVITCSIRAAVKAEIDRRRAETGKTIAQVIESAIEHTKASAI